MERKDDLYWTFVAVILIWYFAEEYVVKWIQ